MHLVETTYSLTFPHFMPSLLAQASGVSINCQTWRLDTMDRLLRCDIDLAIGCREWDERSPMHVNHIPDDIHYVELVQDYIVCLMRSDHPALSQEWNLDTFLSYRQLQVAFGGLEYWLLDDVLQIQGRKRDIAVNMTDFQSALALCEQSDLILCAPSRYALAVMKSFDLKYLSSPIKLIPGAYLLMWHKHFEHDLSHKWLRELIINKVSASLTN